MNKNLVTLVSRLIALAGLVALNTALPSQAQGDCRSCVVLDGTAFCFPVVGQGYDCEPHGSHCDTTGQGCIGS